MFPGHRAENCRVCVVVFFFVGSTPVKSGKFDVWASKGTSFASRFCDMKLQPFWGDPFWSSISHGFPSFPLRRPSKKLISEGGSLEVEQSLKQQTVSRNFKTHNISWQFPLQTSEPLHQESTRKLHELTCFLRINHLLESFEACHWTNSKPDSHQKGSWTKHVKNSSLSYFMFPFITTRLSTKGQNYKNEH